MILLVKPLKLEAGVWNGKYTWNDRVLIIHQLEGGVIMAEVERQQGEEKSGYSTPIGLNEIASGCYFTKIKTTHKLLYNPGLFQDFVTRTRS